MKEYCSAEDHLFTADLRELTGCWAVLKNDASTVRLGNFGLVARALGRPQPALQ